MNSKRNSTQKRIANIISDDPSTDSGNRKRRVKKMIKDLDVGDYFRGTVKILRKVKPGPLILTIFDGTGKIDAIAHDRIFEEVPPPPNAENTYNLGNVIIKDSRKKEDKPESKKDGQLLTEVDIEVDDIVKIFGKVGMHRNNMEIEVKSIRTSSLDFEDIINTQSLPARTDFSIPSERYESMKSRFVDIAQRIRRAVIEGQPILIRHHHDADGICAGLVVEHAIRNIMERREINPKNMIYRTPSVSPFYDQIDLFRDISKYNKYTDYFGDKSPLVLLLDTGSTPENLFALKVLHSVEFNCIIVDHHNPGEVVDGQSQICPYIQLHLNPYLFGWDSQTCGGMLCYELARFLDEELEEPLYPAVAAIADRCDIPEVDRLVEKSGKTREELFRIGMVIDYLSYNFRFDGGEGLYDRVFTNDQLVQLIGDEVQQLFDSSFERIMPTVSTTQINSILFSEVDLEQFTQRGKYPTPGKVLGQIHDHIAAENPAKVAFSVGFFSDGIIIRATAPVLPVPDLLVELQEAMPEANVEGGGHEQAGSIKYIPAYGDQIRQFVRDKITMVK